MNLEYNLQGKRGVWIKLPIEQVNLVEAAVKVNTFPWLRPDAGLASEKLYFECETVRVVIGVQSFRIPLHNLVLLILQEGFRYHHAEADYLMLVHWILETTDTLPANASHRVGIGAFVMNSKRQVFPTVFVRIKPTIWVFTMKVVNFNYWLPFISRMPPSLSP